MRPRPIESRSEHQWASHPHDGCCPRPADQVRVRENGGAPSRQGATPRARSSAPWQAAARAVPPGPWVRRRRDRAAWRVAASSAAWTCGLEADDKGYQSRHMRSGGGPLAACKRPAGKHQGPPRRARITPQAATKPTPRRRRMTPSSRRAAYAETLPPRQRPGKRWLRAARDPLTLPRTRNGVAGHVVCGAVKGDRPPDPPISESASGTHRRANPAKTSRHSRSARQASSRHGSGACRTQSLESRAWQPHRAPTTACDRSRTSEVCFAAVGVGWSPHVSERLHHRCHLSGRRRSRGLVASLPEPPEHGASGRVGCARGRVVAVGAAEREPAPALVASRTLGWRARAVGMGHRIWPGSGWITGW